MKKTPTATNAVSMKIEMLEEKLANFSRPISKIDSTGNKCLLLQQLQVPVRCLHHSYHLKQRSKTSRNELYVDITSTHFFRISTVKRLNKEFYFIGNGK